jgi:hypothetical protein
VSEEPRTPKQNNSLHGTLREYAELLNSGGYSYFLFLEEAKERGFEIDWSEHALKRLFRAVAQAKYGVESTKDLSKKQMQAAYEVFERRLSELSGVGCRWHSQEEQMLSSDNECLGVTQDEERKMRREK